MTRFLYSAVLTLPSRFGLWWIFTNTLFYGAAFGLPFLFADPASTDSYAKYGAIAFVTFGIWTGLAQWLLLRRAIKLSLLWILVASVAPILAVLLALSPAFPSAIGLVFITYPLLVSLTQWLLLRRILRLAWEWMVASLAAIALGITLGQIPLTASRLSADLRSVGVAFFAGALIYGCVYGAITYVGLRRLLKPERLLSGPSEQSTEIDAPAKASWKMMLLSSGCLCVLAAVWFVFMPPLSAIALERMRNSSPLLVLGLGLIGLFGYLYLMIFVHELGHLVLALAYGFDLRAFAVGRWILVRHSKKWNFCRSQKRFAGGFVLPVPKSLNTFDKRSLMMMLSGGSIFTFLLFAVGVLPVLLMPTVVSNSLVLWLIAVLAIISLHSFLLNILPITIGHLRTDGRRFLDLIKDDVPGQSFFALYGIDASLRQGIRPRDIEPVLIDKVLSAPEQSMVRADGLYTAYTAAMDRGQLEQASTYIDQVLENQRYMPELFRGKSFLEGAYFEAVVRKRTDVARQWFEKIQDTTFIFPAALFRVEAALLFSEGNSQAALTKAEQGMVSVGRDRFMKGTAVAEEDLLQDLIQKINTC